MNIGASFLAVHEEQGYIEGSASLHDEDGNGGNIDKMPMDDASRRDVCIPKVL